MIKQMVAVAAVSVLMVAPMAMASENGHGHGRGGHGHGGHGGRGGHGGKGGGTVSAPSVSAPAAGPSVQSGGMTTGVQGDGKSSAESKLVGNGLLTPAQMQTELDTQQALSAAGHVGLVQIDRINADGSFTYSGYEWAVVAFAQQMKALGYNMGTAGEASTNFSNGLMTEAFGG